MQDLDACLRRGSVFHWNSYDKLDDPRVAQKGKFLILINAFLPDDPLYYLLTTSKVDDLLAGPFRDDVVVFPEHSYPFFSVPTAVNAGNAGARSQSAPLKTFREMYYDREIEHIGILTSIDMGRVDTAVSASLRVPKEMKRMITAW